MRTITKLLTIMQQSIASGPANSVPAAINPVATIGTTNTGTPGTWSGSPTLTYQWQRLIAAVWTDIGGATTLNRAPVDADFGYALSVLEIPNGITANAVRSNITNLTLEAPVQTLGSELLTNGDFSAWTTDDPDSWLVLGEVASDPVVTQVDPSGGAGTGAAKFFSSATANAPAIRQAVLTVGSYYETATVISAFTSGQPLSQANGGGLGVTFSAPATKRVLGRATSTIYQLNNNGAAPCNWTVDSTSVKLLTLNTQIVAASANMRISQYYTLPASPVAGDSLWLMPRISDFASGNYWLAFLTYTGSQWDITLYSVASHTRTSRTSATNIGATNGISINMNGNLIDLQTTANAGGLWTTRGSQVNNSTYNTATGVNVQATSPFTLGNTQYEAAV